MRWRYGAQLQWRIAVVGLTETADQYASRGYTPLASALGRLSFRRYGMPFTAAPKARLTATARACRAIVAARLLYPGSEWAVYGAIQLANFTGDLLIDDDAALLEVLRPLPGIDADEVIGRLDAPEVSDAYERDRAETRTAAGSAAELQGKTATTDGPVRFTAPSVAFESDGTRFVAGGFQPVEAYDVLVANLDPTLERKPAPQTPEPLLEYFPEGLTTQEVAALMAGNNEEPDRVGAEAGLIELLAAGAAVRRQAGDDGLWQRAQDASLEPARNGAQAESSSNSSGSRSKP